MRHVGFECLFAVYVICWPWFAIPWLAKVQKGKELLDLLIIDAFKECFSNLVLINALLFCKPGHQEQKKVLRINLDDTAIRHSHFKRLCFSHVERRIWEKLCSIIDTKKDQGSFHSEPYPWLNYMMTLNFGNNQSYFTFDTQSRGLERLKPCSVLTPTSPISIL